MLGGWTKVPRERYTNDKHTGMGGIELEMRTNEPKKRSGCANPVRLIRWFGVPDKGAGRIKPLPKTTSTW